MTRLSIERRPGRGDCPSQMASGRFCSDPDSAKGTVPKSPLGQLIARGFLTPNDVAGFAWMRMSGTLLVHPKNSNQD